MRAFYAMNTLVFHCVFNQASSKVPNTKYKSLGMDCYGFSLLPKKLMHSKDQRLKQFCSFWNTCTLLLYWHFLTNALHFLVITALQLIKFIKCRTIEDTFLLALEIHFFGNSSITMTVTRDLRSLTWCHHSLPTQ